MFNKDDPNIRNCWVNYKEEYIGEKFFTVSCVPDNRTWWTSAPIPVQPNATYTASNYATVQSSGTNPSFLFLDENLTILGGFKNQNKLQTTFTVPNDSNIKYVAIPMRLAQKDKIQFQQGDVATPFVPYGNVYIPQNQ